MQKSIAFYIYSVILVRKVFENNKNKTKKKHVLEKIYILQWKVPKGNFKRFGNLMINKYFIQLQFWKVTVIPMTCALLSF